MRRSLSSVNKFLNRFFWETELYCTKSETTADNWLTYQTVYNISEQPTKLNHQLQGQPNHVYKGQLGYSFGEKRNHTFSILYNEFGKRLSVVGQSKVPDTYERAVGMTDLLYDFRYSGNWNFQLMARNIMDTRIRVTQMDPLTHRDTTISSYRSGPTINFSVRLSL